MKRARDPFAFGAIDITGQRFGELIAIRPDFIKKPGLWWFCMCFICGQQKSFPGKSLREGNRKTCSRSCMRVYITKHGENTNGEQSPLNKIWTGMTARCRGKGKYVKKGIKVFSEWEDKKSGYLKFKKYVLSICPDVFDLIEKGYQIDRIKNKGNYEPGNIRFVPPKINVGNRDVSINVEINGEILSLMDATIKYSSCDYQTVHARKRKGWTICDAVFTPKYFKQVKADTFKRHVRFNLTRREYNEQYLEKINNLYGDM